MEAPQPTETYAQTNLIIIYAWTENITVERFCVHRYNRALIVYRTAAHIIETVPTEMKLSVRMYKEQTHTALLFQTVNQLTAVCTF